MWEDTREQPLKNRLLDLATEFIVGAFSMQATSEDVFMPMLTGAHSIKSLFLQLWSKVWMQGKIYWSPRPIKPFPAKNLRQKEK